MFKNKLILIFVFIFIIIMTSTAYAGTVPYGPGDKGGIPTYKYDSFLYPYFYVDQNGSENTNNSCRGTDSDGFYNGYITTNNEDKDFKIKYVLDFTDYEQFLINEGDIKVKAETYVHDTTEGRDDKAGFELRVKILGDEDVLFRKEGSTTGERWSTEKKLLSKHVNGIVLYFYSKRTGGNIVKFSDVNVFFYQVGKPKPIKIWSDSTVTKKIGDYIYIKVLFDEVVYTDWGEKIKLNFNDDKGNPNYATYATGSTQDTLIFEYKVKEGDKTDCLNYDSTYIELFNKWEKDGFIRDMQGNSAILSLAQTTNNLVNKHIKIDGIRPTIESVTTDSHDITLTSGSSIQFTVDFTENIDVFSTNDMKLELNNKAYAKYKSTTGDKINFEYTVSADDSDVVALDVIELMGGVIKDKAGNELTDSIPDGNEISTKNIKIDTTPPEIRIKPNGNSNYAKEYSTGVNIIGGNSEFKYYWSDNLTPLWDECVASETGTSIELTEINIFEKGLTKKDITGDYYLHIKAEDDVGNISYKTSDVFKFDNEGPKITVDPKDSSTPSADYNPSVTITDSKAGVSTSAIQYQWVKEGDNINDINWKGWPNKQGNITTLNNGVDSHGNWKLVIRTEDILGNSTEYQTKDFLIDMKNPSITISPTEEEARRYRKSYSINITAIDDNKEGDTDYPDGSIDNIRYQWTDNQIKPDEDDNNWTNYKNIFIAGEDEGYNGAKVLHVIAEDNSSNKSYIKQTFTFDNTAPSINFKPNGLEIISESTSTNVDIIDDDNLIDEAYYQWCRKVIEGDTESGTLEFFDIKDGEKILVDNSNWISIDSYNDYNCMLQGKDGEWYLIVKTVDNAGNEAIKASNRFILDNISPDGSIDIEEKCTNNNKVNIILNASDTASNEIQYSISIDSGVNWTRWSSLVSRLNDYSILDQEGNRTVIVKYRDELGHISEEYSDTVFIDKTKPTGDIEYSNSETTNQDVIATLINLTDNYSKSENIEVINNEGEMTHVFRQNGTFVFIISDEAGNQNTISAEVNCIDKDGPSIEFTTDGSTTPKQTVSTIVNVSDDANSIFYQWSKDDDYNNLNENEWISTGNGQQIELGNVDGEWYLHVIAVDNLDNKAICTSNKFVIDNTPPESMIEYNNTNRTANPVKATITFNEPASVSNTEDGNNYYTFTENGEFVFEYADIAGNTGSKKAEVNWIDTNLPKADVSYSNIDWTKENITVTISSFGEPKRELINFNFEEGLDEKLLSSNIEDDQTITSVVYEICNNGSFEFTVRDCDTKVCNVVNIDINNIDREGPTAEINYSTKEKTNEDIIVTLNVTDNSNKEVDVIPPDEAVVTEENGNKHYRFKENGEYNFTLRDFLGNESIVTATINNIDRVLDPGKINYDPSNWCNGKVTATLIPDEEVTILNNSGKPSFVFYDNGSFTYKLKDNVGNESEITAIVNWIDKEPPQGTIEYNTMDITKEDVEVTINTSDNSQELVQIIHPDNVTVQERDGRKIYIISENGSYEFVLKDLAGNETIKTAIINNIDNEAPCFANITYSTTEPTNKDVEATIILSEEAVITPPDGVEIEEEQGSYKFTFKHNGRYEFVLTDNLGNTNKIPIIINNIDKVPPIGTISYSTFELTNKPVIATVSANEEFKVVNNFNMKDKVFYDNGEYTFTIQDTAGNMTDVVAKVSNIDRTPPNIYVNYSTMEYTNKSVIATLSSDEDFIVINNQGSTSFEFKCNGTFKFKIADSLGNGTYVYATVDNIDKISPSITFDRDYTPVFVEKNDYILDDYLANDNVDGSINERVEINYNDFDINNPGEYNVIYSVSDDAGNITTVDRKVIVIPKGEYLIFINGNKASEELFISRRSVLNFEIFNFRGETIIKWKEGRLDKGEMKSRPNILEKNIFETSSTGCYTFYIQDQERTTQLIKVFVSTITN